MRPKQLRCGLGTAGAVLLGLALAASSWAQDPFDPSDKPIAFAGDGPNSEDRLVDNKPRLYKVRHKGVEHKRPPQRPPRKAVEDEKKPTFSWKDGTSTFVFDKGTVNISTRLQGRWTHTNPEARGPTDAVRLQRARTEFEGWFYREELTYELQLNWIGDPNVIRTLNLNWDPSKRRSFQLKVGQFKVPFGRQRLTSSGSQQFVDRSIVSSEFTQGLDIGMQLWGVLANSTVEYRAGIFNGKGESELTNKNGKYQYNARLMFQPFGDVKYSEGDFESKTKPLLAIAGNFEQNDLRGSTVSDRLKRTIGGMDGVFKYKGFSAFGEAFRGEFESETGTTFNSNGYHFQAGYFLIKDLVEVAGRYASLDPSDATANDDRREVGVALNYFLNKHYLKAQADFRQIEDEARQAKDRQVRLQLQVTF